MRLIDADKLKRRVQSVATEAWKLKLEAKVETTLNQFLDYVEQSPTIDAVEVVRGEWIWHEDEDICNCSECEFEIDATGCIEPMEYVGVFRYCPNCGAKMKGEDDE